MSGTVHPRPAAPGLVAALFGLSGHDELPGGVLVALLGDLGTGPDAARRLLARMRDRGQLVSRRAGREAVWAMAGAFAVAARRRRDDRGEVGEWPGHFHALLHRIPEAQRAHRDRLRRAATQIGYASMQPGVLIGVEDQRDALHDVLAAMPPGSVRAVTLGMDVDAAAAVASEAWELPALAADLRGHLASLTAAVDVAGVDTPPPTAATLRHLLTLTNPVFVDLLRDPGLPVVLRPPDWPGDALRRAIGALAATHVPPATAHIHARLAAHGTGPPGPA